ncbi:hypothetical protein Tco_0907926 [Tanacetum coccineum]|uniref:Uncharacterized protein n=1 Tax=Tanacetum coccineum TaxID=301880 RepID=A0ABQ5CKP8_9ASTR
MTKRHSKEAETTRTAKVIENVLDAETRIILSENVRNYRETRTKKPSSEVLGAITMKKMMKRLKTKRVSWLMQSMRIINVTFDETPPPSKTSPLVDDDLDEDQAIKVTEKKNLENNIEDETLKVNEIVNIKESKNHSLENVIGNLNQRTFRSQSQNQSNMFCFISTIEPKNVNEALKDKS